MPDGVQASQLLQRVPLIATEDGAGSAQVEAPEKRGGHRRGRSLTSIIMPRLKGRRPSATAEEMQVRGAWRGASRLLVAYGLGSIRVLSPSSSKPVGGNVAACSNPAGSCSGKGLPRFRMWFRVYI